MQTTISGEEMKIIKLFKENVYGRKPDTTDFNQRHDGKAGHWLERQMGIKPNSNNEPDLFGYEMKNTTKSKTTFGDWSADYRIFKDKNSNLNRDEFLRIFGKPNLEKGGRYSWSGTPLPTIKRPSPHNGSIILIDENQDISIIYSYSNDPRPNKSEIVPVDFQVDNLVLVKWTKENLQGKLLKKFGQNGWFRCSKNKKGEYDKISFGEPIVYENWIRLIKEGVIFFDGGMYETNPRPYSQWRANNNHWDSLITHTYPPFPGSLDGSQ